MRRFWSRTAVPLLRGSRVFWQLKAAAKLALFGRLDSAKKINLQPQLKLDPVIVICLPEKVGFGLDLEGKVGQ